MSANGRRRWRRYAKKCRYLARREGHKAFSTGAYERKVCGRAPERDSVFGLSPAPWSARSLVGMSESHRKRLAWAEYQFAIAAQDGEEIGSWDDARAKYRIGERLRPCIGCCACKRCAVCGGSAACFGAYEEPKPKRYACNECCGHGCEDGRCDPVAGTLYGPGDPCDGTGLLPARKSKGPAHV